MLQEGLKSGLERFVAKRAAVLFLLLAAAAAVFLGSGRWPALAGLLAGAFLGAGRFRSNEWIFAKILGEKGGKAAAAGAALYAAGMLALFAALASAYFLNSWLFRGVLAGLFLNPAVIMLNSVTEAFGVTRNGFDTNSR